MRANTQCRKVKKGRGKNLFYWGILAFPILQFVIFYIGVNLNSFALAFQKFDAEKGFQFIGIDNLFENFINVFKMIEETSYLQSAFKNSLILFVCSIVICLPVTLLFSYYIYKKRTLSRFYKVILFLPHVISSITLVIIYKYFAEQALPEVVLRLFGKEIEGLLSNPDTEFYAILLFTVFISFGVQTLIYSGAMSGISPEIEEAAKLDGITPLKEFLLIDIPMIAPTISVFVVSSTAMIFVNQMNLYSFYGSGASNYSIWTIGYYMYQGITSSHTTLADYPYYASFGLVMTMITIPITLFIRRALNKIDPSEG